MPDLGLAWVKNGGARIETLSHNTSAARWFGVLRFAQDNGPRLIGTLLADFLRSPGQGHGGGDFCAEVFGASQKELLDIDVFKGFLAA
jgi:hypothetical protein